MAFFSRLLERKKPVLVIDLDSPPTIDVVLEWLKANGIETLNVAGSRESRYPGIYSEAYVKLAAILSA